MAYCQTEEPWEQMPDTGEVAEFDLEGHFVRLLHQCKHDDPWLNGELRAPWGLAVAPSDFGALSNAMLVANFGDGTIAGYDLGTGRFIDFVRDASGVPIMIDGLWGITFGNGVSLGDSNALYYAAGPNSEQDGTFGSVRFNGRACDADMNADGVVGTSDFFEFVPLFFGADAKADFNHDGGTDSRDFFDFVSCLLGGC